METQEQEISVLGNWVIDWENRSSYTRISCDRTVIKVDVEGKFFAVSPETISERIRVKLPKFCIDSAEYLPFVDCFAGKRMVIK